MKQYDPREQSHCDLSNYWGRFEYFQRIIDPRNAFYSSSELKKYTKILEDVAVDQKEKSKYANEELWRMRYVVDANIHPQTKEPINIFFRTSTFVETNVPLALAIAVLPPTPFNQICAQAANQSYNFMFNYCNRNTSNQFSNSTLAFSYMGAVSSAIVGSLGTSYVFKKLNAPAILIRVCPLFGVLIANTFNLFFARQQDLNKGIEVFDAETNEALPGVSKKAAQIAFMKTLATRYILPLPMFIPPILIHYLSQANIYPKHRGLASLVDIALASVSMYGGLSFGIGIFPQYLKVNANELESSYTGLRNSKGSLVQQIVFNKGL